MISYFSSLNSHFAGLEEDFDGDDSFKTPRGIRGYQLHGAEFDTWKIAGNLGGEDGPDKVRGVLNEGGLFVERIGISPNS